MKTFKEFLEDLSKDEAFAKEISTQAHAKRQEGAVSYQEALIPVAAEHGYDISIDELKDYYESQTAELSEEELGKLSGGTMCATWGLLATIAAAATSASVSYLSAKI